jgi:nicotinamide-nucleotide amidase
MRIGLINIGDELLAGKILNTNARDLALWLAALGHELAFALTVPDDPGALDAALREALDAGAGALPRGGMLLLSGGLGPTRDDLTREALAKYLGVALERDAKAASWLAEFLGRPVSEGDPQALVPAGVEALRNPAGTACGLRFERRGCAVFAFPGVPREFKALFDAYCRPSLEQRDAVLLRRRLVTFGLGETRQRELLRDFVLPAPFRFSSLPAESEVTLSIEGFVDAAREAGHARVLEHAWNELLRRLPPENVIDAGGLSLPEAVLSLARARGATVTVAESCTGGMAGALLTSAPGSSAIFREGYLTYSDAAKTRLLGVAENLLREHGAVSEPVARAMARGAREAANAEYAVAITGIAGPDGGTAEKPVGLVYIAVASAVSAECERFVFKGDRETVRRRSARQALNQLRLLILKDLQQQK